MAADGHLGMMALARNPCVIAGLSFFKRFFKKGKVTFLDYQKNVKAYSRTMVGSCLFMEDHNIYIIKIKIVLIILVSLPSVVRLCTSLSNPAHSAVRWYKPFIMIQTYLHTRNIFLPKAS